MTLSIAGKHIYLRPLTIEDASSYHKWVSDPEVIRYSLSKWQKHHTLEAVGSWIKEISTSSTSIDFAIVDKRTNAVIGHAGIAGISEANRSGEYFILIGYKSYWNRGIGTEVTRLVVGYAFSQLGLHRIMLTVSDLNSGGLRAYTKAGFQEEGYCAMQHCGMVGFTTRY